MLVTSRGRAVLELLASMRFAISLLTIVAIASTIGTSAGTSRKFPWTRRGATYAYRLGNEWRRLVYGLSETWRERRSA